MIFPSDALKQHIGVIGKTGSGKTYAAKGIVEGLLRARRRVCIVDPTGVWWGLRSSADGKSDGFPVVVLGGDEADLEISEHSGAAAASAVAKNNLPAVIDLSLFTMGERRRFLEAFLKTLHKENREPLHLILDEADEMASQSPLPEMRRVFHEVDRIVRRGRIRGFRVMFITQRPAVLHKNILTQANALITMRLTAPQDRKAIDEWIKGQADAEEGAKVLKSLSSLKVGEGWIWAPEQNILERVNFPTIETFDSGRSPDDDETITLPEKRASVDLSALQKALSVEKVQQVSTSKNIDIKAIKIAAHKEGFEAGYRDADSSWRKNIRKFLDESQSTHGPEEATTIDVVSKIVATTPDKALPRNSGHSDTVNNLVVAAEKIWPVRLTWGALCATQGRKARGGHFNTQRKAAIDGGLLREESGLVTLIDPPDRSGVNPADLLEENLPGSARDMFISLREVPARSWEVLTARLGRQPRGGHFNTGRKILLDNQLVIADAQGVRINAALLEEVH